MSKLIIKNIQDAETFKSIQKNWDQLLADSPTKSVFLTWEWLYSWWKVNGNNKELWLITAWRGDEIVGIAPLMRETRKKFGLSLHAIVNLGTPQNDVGGFLFNPKDVDVPHSLYNYLDQNKDKWDIVELNEFASNGPEHNLLENLSLNNRLLWREEKNSHYFITLENNWEKFSERLARKFRYNLRRALRLAEEIGKVEIEHFSGNTATWEAFQTVIEINRHANYPRLYNSPSEQMLIKELIEQTTSGQSWLDIYILSVNNKPVAYEYGFVYEKRFEDWRSGFDTRFPANVSIGKVLAMQVVQKCIQENYNEIDFLRGDESYKQEWMPSERSFSNIRLFNNGRIFAVFAYWWLQKIKPALKKSRLNINEKKDKIRDENNANS